MSFLRQDDRKDSVAPGARLIHCRRCNGPSLVALIHDRHHLRIRFHDESRKILNVGTKRWMLSYSECALIFWIKQITNCLKA